MTSRTFSTSSSSTNTSSSSSNHSLLQELHPLPLADSSVPPPQYALSDLVFVVGEGDSSREMCEIVDIGYKASEKCYVYDCMPIYNPALQGLFLCRDRDLRKSRFAVGEGVEGMGDGKGTRMRVLDVRYWSGRFYYRIGDGGGSDRKKGPMPIEELLLEEGDLVEMVESRRKENKGP